MFDEKTLQTISNTLLPVCATNTATGTGLGVYCAGYESVTMVLSMGVPLTALSGSVYFTVQFQECATDTPGSYTDIAAADLSGGVNDILVNANGEASRSISRGYKGSLPWVRILLTMVGTNTNGSPVSGIVILGDPRHAPTANDGAQT